MESKTCALFVFLSVDLDNTKKRPNLKSRPFRCVGSGGASAFADYMPPSGEEFCTGNKYNAPRFETCQSVELYLNIMKC